MKILIRTEASSKIGVGHVMRCLALAEKLKAHGATVFFVCRDLPGNLNHVIQAKGFEVHVLKYPVAWLDRDNHESGDVEKLSPLWSEDFDLCLKILKSQGTVDCVVVDSYFFNTQWEKSFRLHVKKIVAIDDLANREHNCDLLLDQNLYPDMNTRYRDLIPVQCQTLLGPKFALLRSEFSLARKDVKIREGEVSRIAVLFGGTDYACQTEKVIRAFHSLHLDDVMLDVIVGPSNAHRLRLEEICAAKTNLVFLYDPKNIAEIFLNADLGIGATGLGTWERACLGLPSLFITFANNQIEIAKGAETQGLGIYLGHHHEVTEEIIAETVLSVIKQPGLLKRLSETAFDTVDGLGSERVAKAILALVS